MNKLNLDKSRAVRTKVKDLVDYFRGNRYGWYETAVLCILAKLYVMDKISFHCNGNVVADRDLQFHLTNGTQQAQTIVDIEETISNSQITKLKNAYRELFDDATTTGVSAKEVHNAFIEKLKEEISELSNISQEYRYAFTAPLQAAIEQMKKWAAVVYPSLYKKTGEIEDFIDDVMEEVEEIKDFVNGKQFDIFKNISKIKTGYQANMRYVSSELCQKLDAAYESKTPWKCMTEAKTTIDAISHEITTKQEEAHQEIASLISSKLAALTNLPSYATLKDNQKSQVEQMFGLLSSKEKEERFIGNLKGMKEDVEKAFSKCFESINTWVEEATSATDTQPDGSGATGSGTTDSQTKGSRSTPPQPKPKIAVRKEKAMNLAWNKQVLESQEDVEAYVDALRQQLLSLIKQNKNIMLN